MTPHSELVCVPPVHAAAVWPRVRHLILRAMERAGIGAFKPVEDGVLQGFSLLWLAWDGEQVKAAAVTSIAQTEWRRVCEIVACGGHDRDQWLMLLRTIEQYAKADGCSAMRIIGRKGWARALPDYQVKRFIMEKDI